MRALYHVIIKTEVNVPEHVKHERQNWHGCGPDRENRHTLSGKDTFQTHIKKSGVTQQIAKVFIQQASSKNLQLRLKELK